MHLCHVNRFTQVILGDAVGRDPASASCGVGLSQVPQGDHGFVARAGGRPSKSIVPQTPSSVWYETAS